jgi:hypothetical protein
MTTVLKKTFTAALLSLLLAAGLSLGSHAVAYAADPPTFKTGDATAHGGKCGGAVNGKDISVRTSIDFGCKGKGNPILDIAFAIIRWLSNGVGLVLIGSLIFGGIQYTTSRGDPQATAIAVNRIRSVMGALLLFIFAYALLNYLIPGNILR